MGKKDEDLDVSLDRFLDEEEFPLDDIDEEEVEDIDLTEEPEEVDPIEALQNEVSDLKDRLMRSLAEQENLRKRAERDRRDAETYGGQKLARDLLSVSDNMKRALETVKDEQREANKGLIEGIELTQRELLSAFAKHKIVPVAPEVGEKFDPNMHQAMFEAPFPDVKAGHILQVMSEGYMIGDRLLRPAQVGVSSGDGS
ncbi:nucleotide exchange factor GrpE [Amylibacter sp. IMCC11727]|uniref:nucleotide exchange factor GrpE n=1 Tax=Amylibacter sp. IMCC11727 TaxID=3039851 RepID=UPI00244DA820|nr:nucleotide exchange factor GrpE [Amylibacter sp. IMCC11727]WGI22065.1 nucleotide exchange factor GrpE [Amylibacter sp. IMCC11727]